MKLSVNPGNNYNGMLGCKTKYCRYVTAVTTIQQLLKEEDIIVMKRRKGADKQNYKPTGGCL